MKAIVNGLSAILCVALAACATTASNVEKREDLLAASGFTIRPADTPKRHALLRKLPAHHFVQRTKNGKAIFLYADPLVCDCLYIGDDKAFSSYQETILQRQMARDERNDQAQLHQESIDDYNADLKVIAADEEGWDWGPWGPGWWW
jgi:hypothetical protein